MIAAFRDDRRECSLGREHLTGPGARGDDDDIGFDRCSVIEQDTRSIGTARKVRAMVATVASARLERACQRLSQPCVIGDLPGVLKADRARGFHRHDLRNAIHLGRRRDLKACRSNIGALP